MNFKSNKKKLGGSIVIALIIYIIGVLKFNRCYDYCPPVYTSLYEPAFLFLFGIPLLILIYVIWSLIQKK